MNGDGDNNEIEASVAAESQRRTPEKSQTSFTAFQARHKQRIGIHVGSQGRHTQQGVT